MVDTDVFEIGMGVSEVREFGRERNVLCRA